MKLGAALDQMETGAVFKHPTENGARVTLASAANTPGIRETMFGEWVIDRGTGWTMYLLTPADRLGDWVLV